MNNPQRLVFGLVTSLLLSVGLHRAAEFVWRRTAAGGRTGDVDPLIPCIPCSPCSQSLTGGIPCSPCSVQGVIPCSPCSLVTE
jgi:hypothetical protein